MFEGFEHAGLWFAVGRQDARVTHQVSPAEPDEHRHVAREVIGYLIDDFADVDADVGVVFGADARVISDANLGNPQGFVGEGVAKAVERVG